MTTKANTLNSFHQNLGKLFYAIAAADGKVMDTEINELKKFVKNQWEGVNIGEAIEAYPNQIEMFFNYLNTEEHDAEVCFNDFIKFKNENPSIFSKGIKKLILKTASAIANSFSSLNKSELIMLAKLDIELKK